MDKEKIIELLDFLKTSLENTPDNNELDKLKGECKRWKNAYFSTEDFQRMVQKLSYQFDGLFLIKDTKLLFEARTGEKYNEN